jgi:hypothetical protein
VCTLDATTTAKGGRFFGASVTGEPRDEGLDARSGFHLLIEQLYQFRHPAGDFLAQQLPNLDRAGRYITGRRSAINVGAYLPALASASGTPPLQPALAWRVS